MESQLLPPSSPPHPTSSDPSTSSNAPITTTTTTTTDAVPTAALVLAGGPATRMGYPKHLLKMPNGRPLYLFVADLIHQACPTLPRIYISLAEGSYLDEDLRAILTSQPQPRPPITTVNADATAADAAVIGHEPDTAVPQPQNNVTTDELAVIWDKKTPILQPPPTRAQLRRDEKKKGGSRERAELKSHKNRSTSSSKRRTARLSDTSAAASPAGEEPGTPSARNTPAVDNEPELDAGGDPDAVPTGSGTNDGPIRGFLAAHDKLPDATWLVIACDYPRLTVSAIQYLIAAYEPPVTCYHGPRGKLEPLVSIWSPEGLARLKRNCDPNASVIDTPTTAATEGATDSADVSMTLDSPIASSAAPALTARGLVGTIRQLHGKTIEIPPGGADDIWLYNVNTSGNWDTAMELHDE